MSDIKPCIFCGAQAKVVSTTFGDHETLSYRVRCQGTEKDALDDWRDTAEEAIAIWNRRWTPSCHELSERDWVGDEDVDDLTEISRVTRAKADPGVMVFLKKDKGYSFHCEVCGANVFTKSENKYYCNGCDARYVGE
jgi:hypothetical protein